MSKVRLPNRIHGEWISGRRAGEKGTGTLQMRRIFCVEDPNKELTLWITVSSGTYKLFINGRLLGFGPRPHPQGNIVYIDQFVINELLEHGNNSICVELSGARNGTPLFWCQADTLNSECFGSDKEWLLRRVAFSGTNAPSFTRDSGPHLPAQDASTQWHFTDYQPTPEWFSPERIIPVENTPLQLELHPLPAPSAAELVSAAPVFSGRIVDLPCCSSFWFRSDEDPGLLRAAVGWIFAAEKVQQKISVFSDDPYRFFCNRTLVSSGPGDESEKVLPLQKGWNRLLFYQSPRRGGMGATLLFAEKTVVLQDMTEEAAEGWLLTGELHFPLAEATAALQLSAVPVTPFIYREDEQLSPGDILRSVRVERFSEPERSSLGRSSVQVYELPERHYGFPRIMLYADPGDTVDLLIGSTLGANGLPAASPGVRGCLSHTCCEGINTIQTPVPVEFRYLALVVRRARHGINIREAGVSALRYDALEEAHFRCSDEAFNEMWTSARLALSRSAAFVPYRGGSQPNDCHFLDAYLDAVNMAAVFGDVEYIATRLRQFLSHQAENGDIPVLTYGTRRESQLLELFFLPAWIVYNYRYSGNRVELDRAVEPLNRLVLYLEALEDEKRLLSLPHRGRTEGPDGALPEKNMALVNALYCRFLLSAAEVYHLVCDVSRMSSCRRAARETAAALRACCQDPDTRLLFDRPRGTPGARCDYLTNFCAVYAGVLPLEDFENFFHKFFVFDPPGLQDGCIPSRHFAFLFLEMLFAVGQRSWALRYLRRCWEMLGEEACADRTLGVFSGARGVLPSVFFVREVLGVRIAEAGHAVIFFNPAFREVSFAEGILPMARGRLRVRWELQEDDTLEVTISSTVPLKVVPEMSQDRLKKTSFQLSNEVTLLKPPPEIMNEEEELQEERPEVSSDKK